MHVMKPIASTDIPKGDNWMFEVKYDGFRCVLKWEHDNIRLMSKNNKDLTLQFPEIIEYCKRNQERLLSFLPIQLDGELVVLNNMYQANFAWIQKRGRLKNKDKVQEAAIHRPASFLAFDLIMQKGRQLYQEMFTKRKQALEALISQLKHNNIIQFVNAYPNAELLLERVFTNKGEGIIAKRKRSTYKAGKNHQDWFKIKNWRTLHGFLTAFDMRNNYFSVAVFQEDTIVDIGKCKHGLDEEALHTLKDLFIHKGSKQTGSVFTLPPAICAAIHSLDLYDGELREPEFTKLQPDVHAKDLTVDRLHLDMAMLPENIELTNTTKLLWPKRHLTKGDLLIYIREIAPYMLPFLKERALTIIRAPDGVEAEHFFQKHLPAYAPDFIPRVQADGESSILCDSLHTLIWLANHGTVEFHVPFQTLASSYPQEIVFDLDPPDRERFHLAIKAAQIIKPILDDLKLTSFVKTSGNKGLQIYIPIPERSMTYEQTALFTQAIAWTVENAYPQLFTTERMKDKRNDRLYIDYVQHGRNKTIIAPYSPRKTVDATVATPLFWDELTDKLNPQAFTIKNVVDRVKYKGCPFNSYHREKEKQSVSNVLKLLQK
ncbi:DNA ligase D [Agaribacter marinus]|uniref:DNA ligase (ATP) n=1 Tax=Virgibacillus salarius TaxID=447199 RepID=A0A941DVK9_9BACI|nr:DNA ligase D [Virgibacillus salarius]MBR7798114.1 DNA ligase D [Virgibacillus salarius]NAZ10823.1 DNA ligase D [Agaribacter marinus]